MTFASEPVRFLFHQLPTETQVRYTEMEKRMAQRGQRLHIEGVMRFENILEVIIRITEQFNTHATAGNSVSGSYNS